MANEIRQNKITGQWIVYATDRDDRPSDYDNGDEDTKSVAKDENCPFCPDNEDMLPGILMEQSDANRVLWQTRVVPNKYPIVTTEQNQKRHCDGPYIRMSGYGHHEVIIEHPRHDLNIADMSDSEITTVVDTYHRRYLSLMQENKNMLVIIFRNQGKSAGTSIDHPHSQLVATGIVPRHIRWKEDIAQRHYDIWGTSLMSEIVAHECDVGERVIDENGSFVCFVPYGAEVPFEMWIVPKRQQADFGAINKTEKDDLAILLRDSLRRLRHVHGGLDYNYVIHSSARYKSDEPHLHWYLQIRPRLVTPAGFEIGTGMLVNPNLPEDDANMLKNVSLRAV